MIGVDTINIINQVSELNFDCTDGDDFLTNLDMRMNWSQKLLI